MVWLPLILGCSTPVDIAQALADECLREPRPGPDEGDLRRLTIDQPRAVCNDGTPAVMYVRAAQDPDHVDDWIILLQGGGFCDDHKECSARFCGSRNLMSSEYQGLGQADEGLLSDDPRSQFAGWNHVELQYCTSDLYTGRRRSVELKGVPSFTLAFEGHEVVLGMLETLDLGAVSDDGSAQLAPLLGARQIVWGGSSAGAHGAIHHLDLVADRYPDAVVKGALDSLLFPLPSALPDDVRVEARALLEELWVGSYDGLWDAYTAGGCGGSVDCVDMVDVQRELQTRTLVRHDLYDDVGGRPYLVAGATERQYALGGLASFEDLRTSQPDNALLGPACGNHIAATSEAFFTEEVVDRQTGVGPTSFHDLLFQFVVADKPGWAVDDVDSDGSTCVE